MPPLYLFLCSCDMKSHIQLWNTNKTHMNAHTLKKQKNKNNLRWSRKWPVLPAEINVAVKATAGLTQMLVYSDEHNCRLKIKHR